MPFILIARDKKDKDALERRMAVRPDHIKLGDQMFDRGEALFGVALLNDKGNMHGSVYVVNFDTRAEVDVWLEQEPYIKGDVWGDIEILPCKVGPTFIKHLS